MLTQKVLQETRQSKYKKQLKKNGFCVDCSQITEIKDKKKDVRFVYCRDCRIKRYSKRKGR